MPPTPTILQNSDPGINLSDPVFWEASRETRYQAFERLRKEQPVSWQAPPTAWAPKDYPPPRGYWAVTRHEDVRLIHRDARTFISGQGVMLYDNLPADLQYVYDSWISTDAPRHTSLRRHISSAFSPRMMRNIERWIGNQAQHAVARVRSLGSCDFYCDIAAPLPLAIIHDMLGIPVADRAEITRLVRKAVRFGSATSFGECIAATQEVMEYARDLARVKLSRSDDDLMTAFVQPASDGSLLPEDDVAATFWLILTAGSDTVSLAASHGFVALTAFPAARRAWQQNFEELADTAVEEILRWSTPVISFRRTAARDTELSGQPIAAGDNVLTIYTSANRDETVFHEPEQLDLSRNPNPQVTFGPGGPHFCLGANLARQELKAFFRELFRQLPDISMSEAPTYVPDPFLDDLESLPCSFTPDRLTRSS